MSPSVPEGEGRMEVDAPYVQALALAALHSAGLDNRVKDVKDALQHPSAQLVLGETVNLSRLWGMLTKEMSMSPLVAGKVLLLMAVHLDSWAHVQVELSQEARMAMKIALSSFPDLESRMTKLAEDMEKRLQRS